MGLIQTSLRRWRMRIILGLLGLLVVLPLSFLASQSPEKLFSVNSASAKAEDETIIYFLRHAEDSPSLIRTGGAGTSANPYTYVENWTGSALVRPLNELGKERAFILGDFFEQQNIAARLTSVVATSKMRTQQTVEHIAAKAGLPVTVVPPGGEAIGGTSTPPAQPTIDYIRSLPLGSVAVVVHHSNRLYAIMQAFGIDTSDPVNFPKSGNTVVGYNNLWIVKIDASGSGELLEHVIVDLVPGGDYQLPPGLSGSSPRPLAQPEPAE